MSRTLPNLLQEVRNCRVCEADLPLGARPILQLGAGARILVVGQAPSARVHASGVPWDDASGERLRAWMDLEAHTFYDPSRVAIIPMGYCYPGRGKAVICRRDASAPSCGSISSWRAAGCADVDELPCGNADAADDDGSNEPLGQ